VDAGDPPLQAVDGFAAVSIVAGFYRASATLARNMATAYSDPRTTMHHDRARQNLDRSDVT
jgi:hypothetical protein